MKATNALLLLLMLILSACYVDVYETGKSSSSYYPYSSDSHYSSSSQKIEPQDSVLCGERTYKVIKMGSQIWTAQNLNETPKAGTSSWCYGNIDENCNIHGYGRLYDWDAAMSVCGTCDGGWRLPTKDDYDDLSEWDAEDLRRTSVWHAVFGGQRHKDESISFRFKDRYGYWWSSTVYGKTNRPYYYEFEIGGVRMHRFDEEKTMGFSVRCIKK